MFLVFPSAVPISGWERVTENQKTVSKTLGIGSLRSHKYHKCSLRKIGGKTAKTNYVTIFNANVNVGCDMFWKNAKSHVAKRPIGSIKTKIKNRERFTLIICVT